MPYFTTDDGTRLYYRVSGKGRPTLLFIHGWCSNLRHWDHQARYFQKRHRVIRVDRPGHGRSSKPAGGARWRDQADAIAALARSLGVRNVVAVGHAGGGATTLELASRHPRLVRALVMVDSGLGRGVSRAEADESPAVTLLEGPDYEAVLAERYTGFFHPATDRRLVSGIVAEAVRTPQDVAVREIRQLQTTNAAAIARRVKQPVLWIAGSNSRATSASVRESLPGAQFAQVVGGGHFPHVDAPGQFNAMMRRFIELL